MSFMTSDFPIIPEDGGAFFNNPECRKLGLGRLEAPAQNAYMHYRVIELFNLNPLARLRKGTDIHACAMAHMVVGTDARARKAIISLMRDKPTQGNAYLMEAMRRIYNFPVAFSSLFYKAFDASYGSKQAALHMVRPIACGTNLSAVAQDYTRIHGERFERYSYQALAARIRAHTPVQLAIEAPVLKKRLNFA